MNEEAQAEQFTQAVDNILHQAPGLESETGPARYRRELDVVQALAAADFSPESQVRHTLKNKLLNSPTGKKEHIMNTPIYQRSFVRLAAAALIIAFLLLAVSPYGATMAQSLIQIVNSWQVGENTTAVSIEGDFEAVAVEDGSTVIQPAPESSGMLEEDAAISVAEQHRQVTLDPPISLERAQRLVDFTILQPTFVPEGYEFQGVVFMSSRQISLDYFNQPEARLFGLLQTAVGGDNAGVQISFSSEVIVENVTVDGHEALWTSSGDEGLLVWEADGVNYQLVGLGNLELALQIAESIQ